MWKVHVPDAATVANLVSIVGAPIQVFVLCYHIIYTNLIIKVFDFTAFVTGYPELSPKS
jgi:hypothetical protein